MSLRDIVDVGRCADDGMHQSRVRNHADVRPYAEVPLVALLDLVHLGVTLAAAVLGGTGRSRSRPLSSPANSRYMGTSYRASSMAGSLNPNHCRMK